MRVVHSCTSHSFSGLENYVLDLVTWQYRQGKSVELYCRAGSALDEKARTRGVPVWNIGNKDRPGPLLWAKTAKEWRRRLKTGPVVLHMHAGGEPWFHLPWLTTKPSSLEKAILHYHIWINHRKKDPVHAALFHGVDEVWSSSETYRAHLSTLLPVAREKMRVVPYGRDVRALRDIPREECSREIRARFGVGEEDMLAVCVSRLEPIKGVGELFDAFVELAPRCPDAHLIIVGDASPNNEEARVFTENLRARYETLPDGVRTRLHLPGYLPEALRVMAAADFYVLPTYEECMSLAMLDALNLGLPILGTNAGGTPSVARPNETGVLVPPRDAKALAAAMEKLFRDPAECRRLGEGARALGPTFDQEAIFRNIWDWYSDRLMAR